MGDNFTMFDSPKMQRAGQKPVSWVNIPITRTVNTIMANVVEELKQQHHEHQQPHQSPKRVRWSEELTQVRDISPRYKASPFRFISPNRNNNNNESNNNNNYWGSPSKTDSWRLNNNNESSWRPDRSHLSLNIRPSFV